MHEITAISATSQMAAAGKRMRPDFGRSAFGTVCPGNCRDNQYLHVHAFSSHCFAVSNIDHETADGSAESVGVCMCGSRSRPVIVRAAALAKEIDEQAV